MTFVPSTNLSSLVALYLERSEVLVRFFQVRTGSQAEAEEIVREIYLVLMESECGPADNHAAYLYSIGQMVMIDRHRRGMSRDRFGQPSRFAAPGGQADLFLGSQPLIAETIILEASKWQAWLASDAVSEPDWLVFEAWLEQPGARDAMDALERPPLAPGDVTDPPAARLDRANSGVSVREGASGSSEGELPWWRQLAGPSQWRWTGVAAAIAGIMCVAILLLSLLIGPGAVTTDYVTMADADRIVTLPDGSVMHLNRSTHARVDWGGQIRRVDLLAGEASFQIVQDASHPVLIVAGNEEIRDTGTEFNVLRASAGLEVTVRSGEVNITFRGGRVQTVTPGMAITIDAATGEAVTREVMADDAFAWQRGHLVYRNATLAQIVADLNRYSATPIQMADAETAALTYTGILQIGDAAGMLGNLAELMPVEIELADGAVVLRRAG